MTPEAMDEAYQREWDDAERREAAECDERDAFDGSDDVDDERHVRGWSEP